MKKRIKQILIPMLVMMLVFSMSACGNGGGAGQEPAETNGAEAPDGEVIEITFGNISLDSGIYAAELFKEVAERESGGTLQINLFHNNVLGDDRSQVEQTIFGDIHIAVSSSSPIASMHNDLFAFDAPFLFFNEDQADTALDGPVGQRIMDDLSEIGLKGLGYWENGFRNFTSDSIPVNTPDDVRGVTIRTMENEIHLAAWNAFGANPTPMAMTEVFTALQQGTIDAQENTMGTIDGFGLYEIQSYISMTGHIYTPFIVVMNMDMWNSLNEVQQNAITVAMRESTAFQREFSRNINEEFIERWEELGVTIVWPSDAEKAMFQALAEEHGVWDMIRGNMDNPELLDQIVDQLN